VYVSVPWSSPFRDKVDVHVRAVDWRLSGWHRYAHYLKEAWALHRAARDVFIVTASIEVFGIAALSLISRRRIVVYDFLCPRSSWGRRAGRLLLWRIDKWIVIRRGDIDMLVEQFAVSPAKCVFVPFPAERADVEASLGDYIYAAGSAHRDWPTFVSAVTRVGRPAIVSSGPRLTGTPASIDARDPVPADEGRRLAAAARIVVVPMLDTFLPSGPLVVVDAMASGKAVIASDVNGTRDYIENGVNGWLVPAGDASALADQIGAVIDDEQLLTRIGAAAAKAHAGVDECFGRLLAEADATTVSR
jgi:hypothetical protein